MSSHGGKGSAPRPFAVEQNMFAENWNKIFGKGKFDAYKQVSQPVHGHSETSSGDESRQSDEGRGSDSERWQHTVDGLEWYAKRFQQQL